MKKTLEISSFYISVPRIMIICYTYFEIMTCDRCNCFSFWTMFCPFTPVTASKNKNFKKMKKIPGDIIIYISAPKIMILCYTVPEIWCVTDELLFFILGYFLPFYPPNSLKNENFKKLKKTPWDIVILHQCTETHNHMLYYFCNMHGRCNFYFSFLATFCPFIPLKAWKIKIL